MMSVPLNVCLPGLSRLRSPTGAAHVEALASLSEIKRNAPAAEENTSAGYIGDPEDPAVLVAFLASPKARYIAGQVVYVDGGARRSSH